MAPHSKNYSIFLAYQYSLKKISVRILDRLLYYSKVQLLVPEDNTSSLLVPPLSVGPFNQSLIFYNCTKPPSPGGGLVETTVCHNNMFVRAADGRPDESSRYLLEGCNATMVPVLGVSGKVHATNYVHSSGMGSSRHGSRCCRCLYHRCCRQVSTGIARRQF